MIEPPITFNPNLPPITFAPNLDPGELLELMSSSGPILYLENRGESSDGYDDNSISIVMIEVRLSDGIESDLETWWPKIKSSGWLVWYQPGRGVWWSAKQ